MRKVVIKISQGSVVTQTVLGGLTMYLPVANFLCFISAKNYENCLRVDKVIAMNTVCSFFWPTLYTCAFIGIQANISWGGGLSDLCPKNIFPQHWKKLLI